VRTSLIEPVNWEAVHGATTRVDDDGLLVLGDSPRFDYHLLRWTDPRARGTRVKLSFVAKPTRNCEANLYVHHWGPRDILSVNREGKVIINEGKDVVVEFLPDGFMLVSVVFYNDHETLAVGLGKPGGQYTGTGQEHYVFRSIDVELLPTSPVRQMLVQRIWRGNDPFSGFPANLFEYDLQGWGSQHPYLRQAIERTQPSVIVEIGVWKGGSTVFMAQAAKSLGLACVVIAVDTWLGSSEHWLDGRHFSLMSFLNGYPALYHKFLSNVIRAEVNEYVLPLPMASLGAAEIMMALGLKADVVHLDAAHDYESVIADLRAWWPVVASGGILIGDDYYPDGLGWPGVLKAFDEFFGELGISFESHGGKCLIQKN